MDKIDDQRHKALLEEYKEAGQLHRAHINLLFGHFAIFVAATGGLVVKFLSFGGDEIGYRIALAVGALLLSWVILVQHERTFEYSRSARARAQAIEQELGLALYANEPKSMLPLARVSAYRATQLAYLLSIAVWSIAAVLEGARCAV